jgi:hypothetical protein
VCIPLTIGCGECGKPIDLERDGMVLVCDAEGEYLRCDSCEEGGGVLWR